MNRDNSFIETFIFTQSKFNCYLFSIGMSGTDTTTAEITVHGEFMVSHMKALVSEII